MNTHTLKKNQRVYIIDSNNNIAPAILKTIHDDFCTVYLCTKTNLYKNYPNEQIFITPTEAYHYQIKQTEKE